jgi:carbon monoxide dehydrogenase subunit G
MRFSGERHVAAPAATVWAALHDHDVLRAIIPGCADMRPLVGDTYAATLEARVGPIADTYRGRFSITDVNHGSDLRVRVRAGGRFGRLHVDLAVSLADRDTETTALSYDADAAVGGVVSRLGRATLTLAGGHFTGCFFRDLERTLLHGRPVRELAPLG